MRASSAHRSNFLAKLVHTHDNRTLGKIIVVAAATCIKTSNSCAGTEPNRICLANRFNLNGHQLKLKY